MLASQNRLKTQKDIENTKKLGKLYQFEDFGVSVYERKDNKPSRFGFIVSTKISKNAVHRNRIKRALREASRRNLLRISNGLDILFLSKKSIFQKNTDEIMKRVDDFFKITKL